VLVGDAFASTCPVTGTGIDKVFTDVGQLCNAHIPAWLASEGMGETKIATFYDDRVKQACDAWSMTMALSLRSVSIDAGLYWRARRWARVLFWLGEVVLRRLRGNLGRARMPDPLADTHVPFHRVIDGFMARTGNGQKKQLAAHRLPSRAHSSSSSSSSPSFVIGMTGRNNHPDIVANSVSSIGGSGERPQQGDVHLSIVPHLHRDLPARD
jgi:hypothetical protein